MKKLITIIVLVTALVSMANLFAQEKSKERIANECMATADSMFAAKDYVNAISKYNLALNTFKEAVNDLNDFKTEIKKCYFNLYACNLNAKNYKDAVAYGESYLTFDPKNDKIIRNIAVVYSTQLKDNAKALNIWVKYDSLVTNDANVKATIGDIYLKMNDNKSALEWYNKALAIKQDADLMKNVASLYTKTNQIDKAIKVYQDYIATNPGEEQVAKTYMNLGAVYDKQKNLSKAAENYELSVKTQYNEKLCQWLMNYYDKAKKYGDEIRIANLVLSKKPASAFALYNRALANYNLNKKPEALVDFQKVANDKTYGTSATSYIKMIKSGR